MSTLVSREKPGADWHRADIVAALHKANLSLRALSQANGLSAGALNNALDRPWPKAEKIIADAIGVAPSDIWPSRYERRQCKRELRAMALQSAAL